MSELYRQARSQLKKFWGFDDFRPGQGEVVQSILQGRDTLVLFPTGGGKSLCYQVPAMVLDGLTLVISPLVALMQDQVAQLNARKVPATWINSTISRREVEQRLVNARNGMYKLLYCAPERLETAIWQHMMPELNLRMIAVDEAHCISEWGHDFRPVYRKIPEMMAPVAGDIRWMALTATATPEVRADIVSALSLNSPAIISRGFNRPNLHWWVVEHEQKKRQLRRLLTRSTESGLVYAGTRMACEKLAEWITREGWKAEPYHAGLSAAEREDVQNRWIDGSLPLVVATNAFGMGIDKPDCRFVVHYDMPGSIEAYYQEAGRAGRDGAISYPVLLSSRADPRRARQAIIDSWPTRSQLTTIYNVLCDHWNLAAGSAMDDLAAIDLNQLRTRARLPVRLVHAGIRLLEHMGMLVMARTDEPKVGVRFLLSREATEEWVMRQENRRAGSFVDRLSRIMGPEAHQKMVWMEQRALLTRMQVTINGLAHGLQVLGGERILASSMIRNEPLGRIAEPRYQRFQVSDSDLMRHRERLLKRLEYMIGYVHTEGCRNAYIRRYFGETDVPDHCGTCDRCTARDKEQPVREAEVKKITSLLADRQLDYAALQQNTGWSPARLNRVLAYMQREELVVPPVQADGRYGLC